ncbi:MAG: putative photosynthetic complex assembly protein PuhE [Burkholderiales bacterium]|nr:putative photosynthetic complex assembly protein PuhE [Burkholderiales bacterium]
MADYALPVAYALFVWWFATGLVLLLDGLPRRTYRWSMLGATALLGAALYGLAATAADATVAGAYVAFTCGVLVWAWQEVAFLTGFLAGPRRTACPRGCDGWRHFGHAIQAILYHELAILAAAAAVVALTWGAPNQVGAWTFLILWVMRQSAKLNLFLGVRNLGLEFLPDHLAYLASFFRQRPMNLLFPVSVTAATWVLALMAERALAPSATPFEVAGLALCGALLGLAILEHWFLVLPLPVAALWQWGLKSRASRTALAEEASVPRIGIDDPRARPPRWRVAGRAYGPRVGP